MHIYLFGYFLLFLGIILAERCRPKIKLIYIIGFIYIAFIAIFRADVGTDTGTYELIISNTSFESWHKQPTELGFNFISALLKEVNSSSKVILRILTALYFILLYIAISASPSNIKKYLLIYFVPATIFVFSMNTLRIGIALNLFIISLNVYNRNKIISVITAIAALLFHVSIIIYIPIIFIFQKNNSKKLVTLFLLLFLITLILLIYEQHIKAKILLYSNYESPSVLSGVSDLIVFFLLIPFFYSFNTKKKFKDSFILISLSLIVISFTIAKISYSGLRILQLIVIFIPFIYIYMSNLRFGEQKLKNNSFWFLFVASVVNAGFILKNFIDSTGQPYGFIPYSFIFN